VGELADALDSVGMVDLTAGLPEQVEAAVGLVAGPRGTAHDRARIENVVVLGMGGSGIGGDVLAATAAPFMPVPVTVVKGYEAPSFVGEATLCFALSFSGSTEETVEAPAGSGGRSPHGVPVQRGGQLGPGGSWGRPTSQLPDIPMPRAGIGAISVPPLLVLEHMGLFPGAGAYVDGAVTQLKRRRDQLAAGKGDAQRIARAHRADHPDRVRRRRHRRGRSQAAQGPGQRERQGPGLRQHPPRALPQRDLRLGQPRRHDPSGLHGGQPAPRLRAPPGHAPLRAHRGPGPRGGGRHRDPHRAEGDSALAQLFDLILQGDYVSLHLAAELDVDPGPIPVLEDLKRALAG
jgi:glucose/mannose-6-phosphate isomerase